MTYRNERHHSESNITWYKNPSGALFQRFGFVRQEAKLMGNDVNVAAAVGAVLFIDWWNAFVGNVTPVVQFVILISTMLYVIFRAVNEIKKFLRRGAD